jgi:TolB protein
MSYERPVPCGLSCSTSETGQREVIGQYAGMTFAPRFGPDGNRVLFSYSRDDDVDVYAVDLRSRRPVRLTSDPGTRHVALLLAGRTRGSSSTRTAAAPRSSTSMGADGSGRSRISFGQGRYTRAPTLVERPAPGDLPIASTRQSGQSVLDRR